MPSFMPKLTPPAVDRDLLRRFLEEDAATRDITTNSIVSAELRGCGDLLAKAPLVLAGVEIFVALFRLLDPDAEAETASSDGDEISPGEVPVKVRATARALLTGERTALNLIQHLSGIATVTRRYVRAVEGTSAKILDTRKTMPGLRSLEKYAVRAGGGCNHRGDLAEAVLIKDNHVRLAGGVGNALKAVQAVKEHSAWIEVEVTNFDELDEAIAHRPDVILLDNMAPSLVREAVERVHARDPQHTIQTEASGGITLADVRAFAEAGVDRISVGALTHSAPSVDLSFEIVTG